jgi:hypothetical protein
MDHSTPDPIPAVDRVREHLAHHLEQARLLRRQLRLSEAADDVAEQRTQAKPIASGLTASIERVAKARRSVNRLDSQPDELAAALGVSRRAIDRRRQEPASC